MMNEIKNLLQEEVQNEIELLSKMELGNDKYEKTVNGITKLADRVIEIQKAEYEKDCKKDSQEDDREFKQKQLESENKDRKVKNVLTGLGIVIPAGLTVWGTMKSLKFETEGTVTTIIGRGFLNKLLPKK